MPPLESLGQRIVILGPSNAGKSTLALALGEKLGIAPVHLDQLRFYPETDWQLRPQEEFTSLHSAAIARDAWIIEGNYSALLAPRLARATGAIVLSASRPRRLARYLLRGRLGLGRLGAPEGAPEQVRAEMLRWVLGEEQASPRRFTAFLEPAGIATVTCPNTRALNALWKEWSLPRSAPRF